MKKLLQLTALLGLATLAMTSRPALAYPLCDTVNGTSCTTTNAKTPCTTSDGFDSTCTCTVGHTWRCLL
jgi:hypothetical protein